jgi:hypothetical protein
MIDFFLFDRLRRVSYLFSEDEGELIEKLSFLDGRLSDRPYVA